MLRVALRISIVLGVVACGAACTAILGIDKDYVDDLTDGGGGGQGDAGDGGDGGFDLDTVCTSPQFLSICDVRLDVCCSALGFSYHADACKARATEACDEAVGYVKAGKSTFHPENIDACLASLAKWKNRCTLDAAELVSYLAEQFPCERIFLGPRAEGQSCQHLAQCGLSSHDGTVLVCSDDTSTCTEVGVLAAGDGCDSKLTVCAPGLACVDGFCGVEPPLHSPCDPAALDPCGVGRVCDPTSLQCERLGGLGASCSDAGECQSMDCQANGCTAVTLVTKASCSGNDAGAPN